MKAVLVYVIYILYYILDRYVHIVYTADILYDMYIYAHTHPPSALRIIPAAGSAVAGGGGSRSGGEGGKEVADGGDERLKEDVQQAQLKLQQRLKEEMFECLFKAWSYSPVSTLSLCLFCQVECIY